MNPSSYENLVAYILTVDKAVLGFLLPIDLLLAIAVLALVMRERKPLEVLALLLISWIGIFAVTTAMFHFVLQRPFLRLEVVHYPWLQVVGTLVRALLRL